MFSPSEQKFLLGALGAFLVGSGVLLFDGGYADRIGLDGPEDRAVDVNSAPFARLVMLPGISPRQALALLEARRLAPLASLEDMVRVARLSRPHAALLASRVAFGPPRPPAKIDVNSATIAKLAGVPGLGAAQAARIVEAREKRGRFASREGLAAVRGIGPARLEKLSGIVSFGPGGD
jgi:competence ComEA-like helix-hairpin-helix protein